MTGTGRLPHDAEVSTLEELALMLLPEESGPTMRTFAFVSWLLHCTAAAAGIATDDYGRLLRNWPDEVITYQLWAAMEAIPTAGELERLRAQIWAPERPGGIPRELPSRHEIISHAKEYCSGRGLPAPAAAPAGSPAGEPSRPA